MTAPTTHNPQETTVTQPHDRATATLAARWYARPNDLIGGWCVMPVDQPPSAGVGEVADFTYREIAEHIAGLHNARLDGISVDALRPIVEAQIGAHLAADPCGSLARALAAAFTAEQVEAIYTGVMAGRDPLSLTEPWALLSDALFVAVYGRPANRDPGNCGHELHGADGGRCPGCGWDSHPIPAGPAQAWDHPLATRVLPAADNLHAPLTGIEVRP